MNSYEYVDWAHNARNVGRLGNESAGGSDNQ